MMLSKNLTAIKKKLIGARLTVHQRTTCNILYNNYSTSLSWSIVVDNVSEPP